MLTCLIFADDSHANPKNKNAVAMTGNTEPRKPKPEEKLPIPNERKTAPIRLSENIMESIIPAKEPITTVIRNRNEKDSRSSEADSPRLL